MASQSTGNLKNLNLHICTLGLRSSKSFLLYAWVCFICVELELHEFRSEVYHTQGVRTTLDDLTSYVIDDSIGAKSFSFFLFL